MRLVLLRVGGNSTLRHLAVSGVSLCPDRQFRGDEAFMEAYLHDWCPRRSAAADVIASEESP